MLRKQVLDDIINYLTAFATEVKVNAAIDMTDVNKYSEDVLILLLGKVYGYQDLKNLNSSDRYNFPAVDLGDDRARVAIQVTSQVGAAKVVETLKKFREHHLNDRFDHLIFFVLGEKPKTPLSSKKIDKQLDGSFNFDKLQDYRDYSDLLCEVPSSYF